MEDRFISFLFNKRLRAAVKKKRDDGVTVITTMHRKGFDQYGREFLDGFLRAWPEGCKLVFYAEGFEVETRKSDRLQVLDLHQQVPQLLAFKNKHSNSPVARGQLKSGYDYRFDAVRFANKAYVLSHAAAHCRTRYMVWLDADTTMFQEIPANFVERILEGGFFTAYLGRFGNHSEAGFLPFDLEHAGAVEFFSTLNNVYESGELFNVREWHDSHIIDCCRSVLSARGVIQARDLNLHGAAHPFVNSAPGLFMDHKKGPDRKEQQRSRNSDYVIPPYWQVDWRDDIWGELANGLCPDEVAGICLGSGWSAVRMIFPALAAGETIHYTGLYDEAAERQIKEDDRLFQIVQNVYSEFSFSLESLTSSYEVAMKGSRPVAIVGSGCTAAQASTRSLSLMNPNVCLLAERSTGGGTPDQELIFLGLERREGVRGAQLLRVVDPAQSRMIDEVLGC